MVLGKTKKRIALLLMVTVMSVFVSGCGGGEEEEATPQRFVYDFEAKAAMAAARRPEAVSEREIPVGTMFPVRLLNRISSAHARVGDVFQIQVLQDVVIDGAVVIPVGSIGQGRVTEANAAGGWGKGGKLRIALDYVMSIDGQPVPIEANEQTAGRDQEVIGAGTVVGLVFLGPLWLFAPAMTKGKNIVLPADTQFFVMAKMPIRVNGHLY